MTSSGRWVREGSAIVLLNVESERRSEWDTRTTELEEEIIPYGCSPCIFGWKICHQPIAAEPPKCYWLRGEYYRCRC